VDAAARVEGHGQPRPPVALRLAPVLGVKAEELLP
jgi:hypothetical protein